MSAAFFNRFADPEKAYAISVGTQLGTHVHPVVLEVMREVGIDLSNAKPQRLTPELAQGVELLITMGCGDECPYVPGLQREDWPLSDPKGQTLDTVRLIRDQIESRVRMLLSDKQLLSNSTMSSIKPPPPHSSSAP